jgi:pyruvate/2-oxoglutarate dehydrogenase complex dihydrolipoamide acyltransferase (E2) component
MNMMGQPNTYYAVVGLVLAITIGLAQSQNATSPSNPQTLAPTTQPAPTQPPTDAPTQPPATKAPTEAPTKAPATQAPATKAPAKAQTEAPTQEANPKESSAASPSNADIANADSDAGQASSQKDEPTKKPATTMAWTTKIHFKQTEKVSALTIGLIVIGSILAMMLMTFIYVFIDLKYCDKTPPADEEEPLQEVVEKL